MFSIIAELNIAPPQAFWAVLLVKLESWIVVILLPLPLLQVDIAPPKPFAVFFSKEEFLIVSIEPCVWIAAPP